MKETIDFVMLGGILVCMVTFVGVTFAIFDSVNKFKESIVKTTSSFSADVSGLRDEMTALATSIAALGKDVIKEQSELKLTIEKIKDEIAKKQSEELKHVHSRIDALREQTRVELKEEINHLANKLVTSQVCQIQHETVAQQLSNFTAELKELNKLIRESVK